MSNLVYALLLLAMFVFIVGTDPKTDQSPVIGYEKMREAITSTNKEKQ